MTRHAGDVGKFSVPSLRNIDLTAPYRHDGRFRMLEQVLEHYNEHIRQGSPSIAREFRIVSNEPFAPSLMLTTDEKHRIIKFLLTLTDDESVRTRQHGAVAVQHDVCHTCRG